MRCNIAIAGVALFCLQSCSSHLQLRPMLDGYPGTITSSSASASFTMPEGWHHAREIDRGVGRATLREDAGSGTIDLLFSRLDPTADATPESQTKAYLRAMHIKTDSTVKMVEETRVTNPYHGVIPVYSMASDYSGYRLYADCISSPVGISAEFYTDNNGFTDEHIEAFLLLVTSLRIKQPIGEQDGGGKRDK